LGKETVQNLLAFRFANGIFEPIWNQNYIDHVQITVDETSGIGTRAKYYDEAGALRDMVPNHLFQLLSLIAMEPPISFASETVRDEKAKLLRSIVRFTPEDVSTHVVRAQYKSSGHCKGYLEEDNVKPDSKTETYVALKILIDNWRWAGVPFYLRTGKRLQKRVTEIAIQFKKPPASMFKKTESHDLSPNLLLLHIQPEEGISLKFGAKVPGPMVRIGDVDMRFLYKDYFGLKLGTGYETLLYDCMQGDATLYQRADMVESAWKVVQPILDQWQKDNDLYYYLAGSSGPKEACVLLA
jgi:glucose-6-phosphate 1-dehydrogenase